MPDCYALLNLNPREPRYAQQVGEALASAVGADPALVLVRFDRVRKKAHVFVPLESSKQIADALEELRNHEAIVDYAIVDRPSEVEGTTLEDYPRPESPDYSR